ncbi:unnamed protein product [Dovyalis caffra]|uniref:Uncharacterized protein n=1 Tax=Dovyalis caffra TaxID=77055 RepID=A0AAV1S6U0_9ROSI|nr:unnamed protein product [Dovyalis caffra]
MATWLIIVMEESKAELLAKDTTFDKLMASKILRDHHWHHQNTLMLIARKAPDINEEGRKKLQQHLIETHQTLLKDGLKDG